MKSQQNWKFHILRKELVVRKRCVRSLYEAFKTSDPCVSRLYFIYLSICFKHLQSQRTLCFYSNEELWWDLEMFKIMSVSFLCVTKYMTTAVVVTVMLTMCLWQRQRTQKSGWLVPKCTLVRWLHPYISTRLHSVGLDRQDHTLMTFLKVHFQRDLVDHLH